MNAGDSCRVQWNRNPLGGFLLHRDCPEDFAPGFCFKFPRWGILRLRTNLIFPQVSRILHRLTRNTPLPKRIWAQPAPYISDLKGIVSRNILTSREGKLNGPPKVRHKTFGGPFKISLIRFYEQQEHLNCSFAFWRHVCNNGSV